MKCQAKRTNGEPCKANAITGMRVCRVHGGKTPKGVASVHFKTGKYSKDLPTRLIGRYQEAMNDTALLEMRADIALIESRLGDLLSRVDTNESGVLWKRTQAAYYELSESFKTQDATLIGSAMSKLVKCIKAGNDDYLAWDEVTKALDQRRRLVESERKRLVEAKQTISAEQIMVLLTAILDTLRRHITDRRVLNSISSDISRLISANNIIELPAETNQDIT